ncbi:hypothetical protein [Bifidobacterium parmae]|uniref:Uncharacterized protein n=1 Tax=Bifidobacterium parmae TaxID=361854 RepID=A0A2N5J5Q6_9BIFI|nr:hypothetical protein [Bifidobacterium parmae]PLS29551.1 hypothetical protein Uis4E_0425 [Bifidobacterium parmae]
MLTVKSMLELDKKAGIYKPGRGYFKNPSRIDLEKAVKGDSIMFGGKNASGTFMYVLNADGRIIFGARRNPYNSKGRSPHPTLLGGKDPIVQAAGLLTIRGGKIVSFDDQSGHFRPSSKSMDKVETALRKIYNINHKLFSSTFIWRKK